MNIQTDETLHMRYDTVGDQCICVGPIDTIIQGSSSVFICGKAAARKGEATAHGGTITTGCSNVFIGG
jgi:uncharacterized Zn-binding protein involved in type VI secretion